MPDTKLRNLPIDRVDFCDAFGEDADFPGEMAELAYVDRETGEVLRVFASEGAAYI